MRNAIKMGRLAVEDMTAAEQESFYAWLGKQLPERPQGTQLNSAAKWWLEKLKSGNVVPGAGWPKTILVGDVVDDYVIAMKRNISRRGNATAMGRFLRTVGAVEKDKSSIQDEGAMPKTKRRRRHYTFHDLGSCREAFEAKYGPQDWPPVDDAQEAEGQCPNGE